MQLDDTTSLSIRRLGITSLVLGVLGAAFYWWTPTGMVISAAGVVFGFVGWTLARRTSIGRGMVIAGALISVAALAFASTIASLGLETVRFTALR